MDSQIEQLEKLEHNSNGKKKKKKRNFVLFSKLTLWYKAALCSASTWHQIWDKRRESQKTLWPNQV